MQNGLVIEEHDIDRIGSIDGYVLNAMIRMAEREECFVRETSAPLIAKGYRIKELVLVREVGTLGIRPGYEPLSLEIGVPHSFITLFLRRLWRVFFPYHPER